MVIPCFIVVPIALLLFAAPPSLADDDDDVKYVCEIAGSVKPCDDKADYKVQCDLNMENNGDHAVLAGTISIKEELGDGDEIKIDIVKEQDNGVADPVFKVVTTVCEALSDKDTPWYCIFEAMGLDGCPIKAGDYKIENLRLDLSSMNSFMTHDYVGEYGTQLSTGQKNDVTSCHKLSVAIMEEEK